MKKPVLKYDSRGPSGNIYWILGQVKRILQQQGRKEAYDALWARIDTEARSYKEALEIIGEEVELIDTAN